MMGGVNIYCGTFIGRDKSGTPFEEVLADIADEGRSDAQDVIRRIHEALETGSDHVLVQPDDASALMNDLAAQLDRYEPDRQSDRRKICAEDLLKACQAAVAEGEPIALVW
jgi:hypothetical protein